MNYDIIIIGASFAGLTMAHHLPQHLKVLVVERKPEAGFSVESTGLITQQTKDLMATFVDLDPYLSNDVTGLTVVAPDFKQYFTSRTPKPWMYTTETPELIQHMADTLPGNVQLMTSTSYRRSVLHHHEEYPVEVKLKNKGKIRSLRSRFVVGADGGHSQVARMHPRLSVNTRFLAGLEKAFYGHITLGDQPEKTVYHFWFGEFSLGYGGWLSPTLVNGKPAFRVGLAKNSHDVRDLKKLDDFIEILKEKGMIQIEKDSPEMMVFGSMIPIGGTLRKVSDAHHLLIGDAAGLCGAFAADGIKGAVISGKVGAELVSEVLDGNTTALQEYYPRIDAYGKMMRYYRKQVLYRFLWDRMQSDRSFQAMYAILEQEKSSFLKQYCDSKDRQKSLIWVVLKWKYVPRLLQFAWFLFLDLFKSHSRKP